MSAAHLPSNFSSLSTEALMMLKPGCRGDPRMNRAVAAKLENPDISLYDALDIGGFTYPRNVDAATMDNDRVTLGQRKNQLNRRLRLARQNLKNAAKQGGSKSKKASGDSSSSSTKPSVKGTSPLVIANSYMRQRRNKVASKPAATKRAASSVAKVEQPPRKKQCQQAVASSSSIPSVAPSSNNHMNDLSLNDALHLAMMAECENGNCISHVNGDDFTSLIASLSTSASHTSSNALLAATGTAPQDDDLWWPTINASLNQEDTKTTASMQQQVNLVGADHFSSGCLDQNQVTGLTTQNTCNIRMSVVSNSRVCSDDSCSDDSQQQQNVGETSNSLLFENAAALGGQLAEQTTGNSDKNKEDLALLVFQSGLQDLYKKSMGAAGFTPQEASESSRSFHKFAFQAWKNECERLQVLLQDHDAE